MMAKYFFMLCFGLLWLGTIGDYLWYHDTHGMWSFVFGSFILFMFMGVAMTPEEQNLH